MLAARDSEPAELHPEPCLAPIRQVGTEIIASRDASTLLVRKVATWRLDHGPSGLNPSAAEADADIDSMAALVLRPFLGSTWKPREAGA